MMLRWSKRARHLCGLAILFGGTALVSLILFDAMLDARTALAERQARLGRYNDVASQRGRLEAEIARLEDRKLTDYERFVDGPTPAQANATLQDHLDTIIQAQGSRIESTQVLDARGENGLEPVKLRITFSGTDRALRGVIHALETGRPTVLVDGMIVQPKTTMRRFRAEVPGGDHSLDVTLDVTGFRRPEA